MAQRLTNLRIDNATYMNGARTNYPSPLASLPSTHRAVALPGKRTSFAELSVPVYPPVILSTIPAYLAPKIPSGLSLKEAATVPVNLVTIVHSATADLNLELS